MGNIIKWIITPDKCTKCDYWLNNLKECMLERKGKQCIYKARRGIRV